MAGWRVGFAVGNKEVVSAINLLQDHLYVSLFPAIQEAAASALLDSQSCVEQLVQMYEGRRNVFIEGLRAIGWDVKAPAASFFAWLKVPKGFTSESFADYLLTACELYYGAAGCIFYTNMTYLFSATDESQF